MTLPIASITVMTVSSVDGVSLTYEAYFTPTIRSSVIAILEGYDGTPANMPLADKQRMSGYGFCVFPYLRGRSPSGGSKDSNGYEIQDIVDCITAARALFPLETSGDVAYVVGYSGGGGNVLGCLSRFPDFFAAGVDHFGMSSFSSWWTENSSYRDQMNLRIGGDIVTGTPANFPDKYASRETRATISNYTGGFLWVLQDPTDVIVIPAESEAVIAAMSGAGLSNYAYDLGPWGHTYPVPQAEYLWAPSVQANAHGAWSVPLAGTFSIGGWITTKRFRLLLGDGLAEFGQVIYDMTTRVFTITVTTGAAAYTLTLYGQTPNASISATINGVGDTQTSNGSGVVVFTGSV